MAWRAVNKAESFDGLKAIGAALAIGKARALKVILSENQRRRLCSPQQNVKRWRKETQQTAKPHRDDIAIALAVWRRFCFLRESSQRIRPRLCGKPH
jgi:hypothetical protein